MVRAAELCDVTPIVRVQSHDPSTITRALDRGAGGVQVPHVNTRAEAEAVVRHAKFAPIGHRGFAGGRSAFGEKMHDYTRRANEETMVVVMLEELEALHNLDDILEGRSTSTSSSSRPGDLAQSMGHPGQMDHPAVQAAIDDAVKRIRAAGRAPGVLSTPGHRPALPGPGRALPVRGARRGPRARHKGLPRRLPARLTGASAEYRSRKARKDGHDESTLSHGGGRRPRGRAGRGRRRCRRLAPSRPRSSRRTSRRPSTPSDSPSPAASRRSRSRRRTSSSSRRG